MKPRTRRAEETRLRIVQAALEIFAQKGYHETTMDEIATTSHVSKGALYFHFPSKRDLFLAIVDGLAHMLLERMQTAMDQAGPSRRQKMRAALETGFQLFEQHRLMVHLIFLKMVSLGPPFDAKLMEIHDRIARLIQSQLDAAVAEGSIPPMDTRTVAILWVGAIHQCLIRWLYERQPTSLMSLFPTVYTTLLRSIGLKPEEEHHE